MQLIKGIPHGKIVTSSEFTSITNDEAELAKKKSGYDLELVDADRLLKYLGVYNETLPPLYLAPRFSAKKSKL